MKFSVELKPFAEAISHAVLALPPKATDFRFESVLLSLEKKKLSLFTTDGDISFTTSLAVDSSDKGSILLNAKRLQDILRSLPDETASFETKKKESEGELTFTIDTGRGKYKISGSSERQERSEKKLPTFDLSFSLSSEDFKDIADKTLFAVSVNSMRPAMMGVLLELHPNELRAVATDGHRLSRYTKVIETGASSKVKVIVPARVFSIVQRALDAEDTVEISVATKEERIQIKFGETAIVAGLIAETYPNYEAVIPLENDKKMIVNRANLAATVKRVARFSSRGDVRLQIESDAVKVSAENADEGAFAEEVVPCQFNDKLLIGFNAKFLEDALSHLDEEETQFEFSTPTRAAVIRPVRHEKKSDDILILVMPVQLNV
ncbi:MAG: DNA polymerase III subunit beta [Chloroherpetonaceae bacterium]|nr:DNA polymerase III subunit beta [Chloroherpetonaceae bacterium]